MKKIILFITLLSPFIHSCSFQKNNVSVGYDASLLGTYSDNTGNLIYDSATLYLLPKKEFIHIHWPSKYSDFLNCDTVRGNWRYRRGILDLRTEFKQRLLLSKIQVENISKDSVKIQFLNYSNRYPHIDEFDLRNDKGEYIIIETDSNGFVTIPLKTRFIYLYDLYGNFKIIKDFEGGSFYQFQYYDCYPLKIDSKYLVVDDTLKNADQREIVKSFIKMKP